MINKKLLELEDICKFFPGVKALDEVKLNVNYGEVHALCGENGAGKSTLMKIISGAQKATSGKIIFEENEIEYNTTKEAQEIGISMIYQEFNLVPALSVAENIFLGKYPEKNGFIDWKKMNNDAKELMKMVGLNISPQTIVSKLSVAESQMVEIAKCMSNKSKLIIMDEPTAALNDEEIKCLFDIINNLRQNNISVLYVSHRMEEIFELTDRITVFRDGKYIKTLKTKDTNYDEIVTLMVGKAISDLYPKRSMELGETIFQVSGFDFEDELKDINFHVKKGEILGISGLLGSGTTTLCKALFGYYGSHRKGEIIFSGNSCVIKNPKEALDLGMSLVPDDRKFEGLVLSSNVRENINFSYLDQLKKNGFLDLKEEIRVSNEMIKKLNIKTSSAEQIAGTLSGGNQQKIVISKMLLTNPKLLILMEPTRGIDVGARSEIYELMNELTKSGISIILVTSDLAEMVGMADRVLVMKSGEIVSELNKENISQENILAYATGGKK